MTLLNREQILGSDDRRYDTVNIPEWGGTVRISSMTGSMRDMYERTITEVGDDGKLTSNLNQIRAKLLAVSIVDAKGLPLFTAEDITALGNKSADAIDIVYAAISSLNLLTKDSLAKKVKN